MKKLMPEHVEYWIKKGMSLIDAEAEALRRAGGRCKSNKNYWLLRGYSDEEANINSLNAQKNSANSRENKIKRHGSEEKYLEWVKEKCPLSKDNMLKNMSLDEYQNKKRTLGENIGMMKPQFKEYWIMKGYSEEEAIVNANKSAREGSVRCVEYWLKRGYSEEDTVLNVSEKQNLVSLKKFKSRYGDIIGIEKYNTYIELLKKTSKRSIKYWLTLGHSNKEAALKVYEYQSFNANQNQTKISYWLDLGYTEDDAEKMRYDHIASKFANCELYWTSKGYSKEDAIECVKIIQSSRGKRGALSQRLKSKSSLETKFNDLIEHGKTWSSIVITESGNSYFPDFEFDNFFVEINGDYWHGNPNIYGPEAKIGGSMLAKEKWNLDKIRNEEITKLTGKPVYIIWESEFANLNEIKRKIDEYIKNC